MPGVDARTNDSCFVGAEKFYGLDEYLTRGLAGVSSEKSTES